MLLLLLLFLLLVPLAAVRLAADLALVVRPDHADAHAVRTEHPAVKVGGVVITLLLGLFLRFAVIVFIVVVLVVGQLLRAVILGAALLALAVRADDANTGAIRTEHPLAQIRGGDLLFLFLLFLLLVFLLLVFLFLFVLVGLLLTVRCCLLGGFVLLLLLAVSLCRLVVDLVLVLPFARHDQILDVGCCW